jgi:hypothetical protein
MAICLFERNVDEMNDLALSYIQTAIPLVFSRFLRGSQFRFVCPDFSIACSCLRLFDMFAC